MAPINIDLQGWDAAGSSGVTVLSLLILFTLAILVLTLCASCRKQSFELEGAKVQRNSSSLVRVVKLEEAVEGTQNPRADDIQTDEIDLTPIPEDGTMAGPLEWRSHTRKGPDLDKVLGNGTSGGVTVNASTPQFNMGYANGTAIHKTQSTPPFSRVLELTTSSQSALSTNEEQNRNTPVAPENPTNLDHYQSKHTYMTIEDQNTHLTHTYMTIEEMKHDVQGHTENEDSVKVNPYATFQSINGSWHQEETAGPSIITLEEDMEDSVNGQATNITYARVSKKIKSTTLPPTAPSDDNEEEDDDDPAPPLPDRTETMEEISTIML